MEDIYEQKDDIQPSGPISLLIGIVKVAQMEASGRDSHWRVECDSEKLSAIRRDANLFLQAVRNLASSRNGFDPLDLATMIRKDEYIGHSR